MNCCICSHSCVCSHTEDHNYCNNHKPPVVNIYDPAGVGFLSQGWQCPICKTVYAPHVQSCWQHQIAPSITKSEALALTEILK